MAASASETETRVPPAPSVSTSTPTPTPNGAPYARPPDSPVTSASDVEQSACASQSAARAAAATCADTFLEHKFAEVARAPSLAVILEELEAHKFRVRPLRLGELRATERSATVCSLLELLSSSALESAASQAVLETLVQMLMLCSGQSPPDAEPDANSDAQPAPAPVSAAVAVAEGSSVGVPYVPYVPLVVEHTATQRAAGFVLLTLELKFLHLCASRGRVENLVVCAEFEREWGTLLRRGLLRAAVELARALGCYKVTTLRPATDEPVDPAADAATGHVDAAFDQVGLKPDLSDYHMLLYVPK